ncbi:hypothetical protein TRFO_38278 [Tritrichomonas foetus]|uniref:Uncharacterized protein n=1 Tax=Tritrichomonas foetus TaxID=1144522 RepID=A0A1J4J8Z7_9EUKA|nr:hypothetical protein TRFO_38278 [Tritrichomonas foetus]|eukprot:OHS95616.1 hypothetical protein TRFO_38278 [Tritrichomonas foetus]
MVTSSFKNKILIWNYNSGSVIQSVKLLPESPLITFLGFYEINSRVLLIRAGWDKTICAYSESEYGSFDLVRKYTGHTSDISTISGFSQGIISGSVTGEIFEWSLDTTFPVASKSLYPSATVEVIQCFTNYMIVGDSNGMLHIFSIPKLILTDSLQAHGIIVRHSISSIAISTEKKIMFTTDTPGCVKRRFFNETQNELNLIGSDIVRCHNDEITQIIFCSNDDFYATCSTDQCVRIWKTETNEYVGFFSDVSKWSLHDPTTWIGQSPFEKEDNHFTKKNDEKDPNEMRFVLPTSSVESVLSLPEEQMSIDSPDENDPNQSQQQLLKQQNQAKNDKKKTLDFDLVRKTLDEYTNSDREIKYRQTHVMELIKEKDTHKEPIRQPKLLHLSQRPVELLSTINNILNNDNPSRCSNTKPVLKIPMVPPRTPKSGTKKKSQSRMMYAPTLFD